MSRFCNWLRRLFRCSEPKVEIVHLTGRNARNSVSDCIIQIDPRAPYTAAVFAQELWEWEFKERTGKPITTRREVFSHEIEVQAAVLLYDADEHARRADEAWQMLESGSYAFASEGWSQKQIFDAMRDQRSQAAKWVIEREDELRAFQARLVAWRAGQ